MANTRPPADDGLTFALDIGTRSVVGIAGRRQGDLFVVEAHDTEPHPRRAMIDGQIEDIDQVAKVAGAVKARMEEKLGLSLRHVSVAAAGRALKTTRAEAETALSPGLPVSAQVVFQLENQAINTARLQLENELDDIPYTCVGHSVVQYRLDGYPFSSILDHRGSLATVEIIATFLPTEVVQSLRRCMDMLELEIDTLTLEPIAAIRAVIPPDIRLLNLALVDIGAGTSDIALSRDGAVSGFTMATVAGDEVTEALIRKLLVDFATAEHIKLALGGFTPVYYRDILGFEHEPGPRELLEAIEPAVDTLAQVVADKILDVNGGPPQAVFLVGGGSHTPGLPAKLTEKLGLEPNRVALAGNEFSGKVLNEGSGLDGPEYATPVGIALTAADNAEKAGASVTVNGGRVRLFTGQSASVMDALLLGGYRYSDLMGRNGRSLTFMLNGVRTVLRGTPYTAAELAVNGLPASLSTPVEHGDAIDIVPATSGVDARATAGDWAEGEKPMVVTLNGQPLAAGFIALIDGVSVPPETAIHEQDEVEVYHVRTVAELCEAAGVETEGARILVNGKKREGRTALADGDDVEVAAEGAAEAEDAGAATEPPADAAPAAQAPAPAQAQTPAAAPAPAEATAGIPPPAPAGEGTPAVAPEPHPAAAPRPAEPQRPAPAPRAKPTTAQLQVPAPAAKGAARPTPAPEKPAPPAAAAQPLRLELNGKTVMLPPKAGGGAHLLLDMLSLVDIDLKKPQGTVLVRVNGESAPYQQVLASGDVVEIGWEAQVN